MNCSELEPARTHLLELACVQIGILKVAKKSYCRCGLTGTAGCACRREKRPYGCSLREAEPHSGDMAASKSWSLEVTSERMMVRTLLPVAIGARGLQRRPVSRSRQMLTMSPSTALIWSGVKGL